MSLPPRHTLSFDDWLEADGRWILSEFSDPRDSVPLDSVDCRLALGEIYDKVAGPSA